MAAVKSYIDRVRKRRDLTWPRLVVILTLYFAVIGLLLAGYSGWPLLAINVVLLVLNVTWIRSLRRARRVR
jgi:hypothetical protein